MYYNMLVLFIYQEKGCGHISDQLWCRCNYAS